MVSVSLRPIGARAHSGTHGTHSQKRGSTMLLDCGHEPSPHGEHTTGTAHTNDGQTICWDCAAMGDLGRMLKDGDSNRLPLYLSKDGDHWKVSNWLGTLTFTVYHVLRNGYHNIARTRQDVWFNGPDGYVWHGVCIGEWTQVCHCKRTREMVRKAA